MRVVRGHIVEIQNGQQVPQQGTALAVGLDEALRLVHNSGTPTQESVPTSANQDPTLKYRNLNGVVGPGHTLGTKHSTCNGDLDPSDSRLMHSAAADTNRGYFHETFSADLNQNPNPLYNGVDKFQTEKLRVAEQERLRQEAFGKNAAPKLAFMNYGSNQELTEGALPTTMGRNSPAGSLTSLDSLDEVLRNEVATGSVMTPSTQPGIITKTKKANSASRRRVKFCDSIEFDDGVVGQLVTHEKQSTKHYINLYNQSLAQQQSGTAPESVETTSVLEQVPSPLPSVAASPDSSATSPVSVPRTSSAQNVDRNSPKIRSGIMVKNNGVTTHVGTWKEPISTKSIPSFDGDMSSNPTGISILKRTTPTQEGNGHNKLSLQANSNPRATVKHTEKPVASSPGTNNSRKQTQRFVNSAPKNQLIHTPSTNIADGKQSSQSTNSIDNSYNDAHTRTAEINTLDGHWGSTVHTSPLPVGSSGSSIQDSLEILSDSLDESDSSAHGPSESCPVSGIISDGAQVEQFISASSTICLPAQHSNREVSGGPEAAEYCHGEISPIDSVPSPFINHVTFASPAGVAIPAYTNSSNYLPSSHSQQQNFFTSESRQTCASDSSMGKYGGTSLQQEGNVKCQISAASTVEDDESTTAPLQYNVVSNNALYAQNWHPRSAAISTGASRMYSHSVVSVPAVTLPAEPVPLHSPVLEQTTTKPSLSSQIVPSQDQPVSGARIVGSSSKVSDSGQANQGLFKPSSTVSTAEKQMSKVTQTTHSSSSSNVTLNPSKQDLPQPLSTVQGSDTVPSNFVDNKTNNKMAWFVDGSEHAPFSEFIPNENQNLNYNVQTKPERTSNFATGKTRMLQKGSAIKKPPTGAKPINAKQPTTRLARDKTGKQISRKKAPIHNIRAKSSSPRHTQREVRVNKKDQNTVLDDDDQVMKSIVEDMDKISLQSRLNSAQSLMLSPGPGQGGHDHGNAQCTPVNLLQPAEYDNQLHHDSQPPSRIHSASRRVHNPGSVSSTLRTRQPLAQQNSSSLSYNSESQRRVHASERRTVTDSGPSYLQRSQSAGYVSSRLGTPGYLSRPDSHQGGHVMYPKASQSNNRTSAYVPYTAGVEAWSGSNAPQVSMQASRTQHVNYSPPSHLKRSVSLDRTPTDDEINYLWDRVRVCLNNKSTQSAGSDSCVNKIDVRGSRTASGPVMPGYQHTAPYGYVKGLMSATPTAGFNTIATPTFKRYGSYDGLRRYGSNDSINMRRSSLLQQRAARAAGQQNIKPPLPGQQYHQQQQFSPAPSRQGPAQTASTRGKYLVGYSPITLRPVVGKVGLL